MRIGTMFPDVFGALFRAPVTQRYPFEKSVPPERFRGKLAYNPSACTGCGLCVKDCPSHAINLFILDRAAKRYVLSYEMDRCTYCGQCVQDCKFKCIQLYHDEWELAALSKSDFSINYGKKADVAEYMDRLAHPIPENGPKVEG